MVIHFLSFVAPFYIAADDEKKTIIVSIRGTLSATDILTDINAVEDVLETELFGNGHCHSGKSQLIFDSKGLIHSDEGLIFSLILNFQQGRHGYKNGS